MKDHEQIRMMTKIAEYEKQNRKLLQIVREYYRSDYIGIMLLKNLIRFTIAYMIGFALYVCYSFNEIMQLLNTMNLESLVKGIVISYFGMMFLFLLITYLISHYEYFQARKKQQHYKNELERLVCMREIWEDQDEDTEVTGKRQRRK